MRKLIGLFSILLALYGNSGAVSISPEILSQLKAQGRLPAIVEQDLAARSRGVWSPNPEPYSFGLASDIDTLYCLAILVDFDDMRHESGLHTEPDDFDSLLFSTGVFSPGSMTDYYIETSYDQALLLGVVTIWYRMPELYSYYVDGQRGFGSYPNNAQRLTEDAVIAADDSVDFSLFDNDGDTYVDALFVVHAGPGYEDTGNLNYIHSHAWVISQPMILDGVTIWGYSMEPEETGSGGLVRIGVFCHEFGHVLGLPDLYDYDYDSDGVGVWSIMAGGSWGGGGARPVHFDAWSRTQLGFAAAQTLTENLYDEQIDAVEYSPDIYQLYSMGAPDPQYFLVENRQRRLFDLSLPTSGLLIFHVDESVPNNNDQSHFKVAVEQADGEYDLENNRGGDSGDPWPGSTDNRQFDDYSEPNSNLYFNIISQIAVKGISDSDSTMQADLEIQSIDPFYVLDSLRFVDDGNHDGRPDAGESCELIFTARNTRAQTSSLAVYAYSDGPMIFSDNASNFGQLPTNEPFNNLADPMSFAVPANILTPQFAIFTLRFIARDSAFQQEFTWRAIINHPDIILVDDDNGAQRDTFFTHSLDQSGFVYESWDVNQQGIPTSSINQFPFVLWLTGDSRSEPLAPGGVDIITAYLNSGGRLLMTSQDFVQRLTERGDPVDMVLLNDYLKVGYDSLPGYFQVLGDSGFAFEGQRYATSGAGGAGNQTSRDALITQSGGIPLLTYGNGNIAGVGFIGNYGSLTVGFGAEAINDIASGYNDRWEFLEQAMEFLSQVSSVDNNSVTLPEIPSIIYNYPNPFNARTNIFFTLSNDSKVALTIFNLIGQQIDEIKGDFKSGENSINWNAADKPSGIYFYKLQTSGGTLTNKMLLLK